MIDGTKIHISPIGTFKEFVNNKLFDFHINLNEATGECFTFPKKANFNSLRITVKSEKFILLTGSLHEQQNSGANDSFFNYSQLSTTVKNICTTLNIDAFKSNIQNLEFGVNMIVPFNVDGFLKRLVCYKQYPFTKETANNKTYFVCKLNRYWIKIYNKGKQYERSENILRFEIKVVKMKHIELTGMKCLSNLLDKKKLVQLGVMLEQAFNEIIYTDKSIIEENLTNREKLIFAKGNNKDFRDSLDRKERYKFNQKYKKIINSHGTETYFQTVKKLIPETWEQLLYNKIGDTLTDYDNAAVIIHRRHFNRLSI